MICQSAVGLMNYQNFISLGMWELIATWANLLILFLLCKKFLFVPVKKMLDKRAADVKQTYDEAEATKTEAIEMKRDYEQKLSASRAKATEIVQDATKRAQAKGEEIIAEANVKAAQSMKRAEAEIERDKVRAMTEIKDDISGMAIQIAEKVIEKDIAEKDHEKLIDEFIKGVGEE